MPANPPLIELDHVSKIYQSGDSQVRALDDVSLRIEAGEFIAIVGQSGSGKSTLMNILGCLDRPSQGHYRVRGVDVAALSPDALASLRRDTFGFVFQRYNLLPSISAAENVELPAIYAGHSKRERAARAQQLLQRLGLGDRTHHRPNQLSGGQQQRVSIARALVNGAEVILADEPTGALDSHSGAEVLALLKDLHAQGRTIILITHDAGVAAHAQRRVQFRDGRIIEDSGRPAPEQATPAHISPGGQHPHWLPDLLEAIKMALNSLRTNLFRSALTLLGVIIGVAAVVTMLAIGNGSKQDVLQSIEAMGSNLLLVRPGSPGQRPSGDLMTMTLDDAEALKDVPGVLYVSPERRGQATLRYGGMDYRSSVSGVWETFPQAQDWPMARGTFFNQDDVNGYAAVVVLGKTAAENVFGQTDPIGKYLLVGNTPFEVIGLLASKGASPWGQDMDDVALVPMSTGLVRLFGRSFVSSINVKIASADVSDSVQETVRQLLLQRHGTEDFQVRNTASLMETVASTQNTLTILLGSIAAISLLVGGIGVMNIMLVNVTERTREIGLRMATGARSSNILLQFNTEAMVVCGIGGLIGVGLGFVIALAVQMAGVSVVFTAAPPLLAFGSAFFTGVLFGFLPARKAAQLDPVVALASE